jgi:hypothetical protein
MYCHCHIIVDMALERKAERKSRPTAFSFRLSEEAAEMLKVLSVVLNRTQVELIESLLAEEFKEAKRRYPREVAKAEREIRK